MTPAISFDDGADYIFTFDLTRSGTSHFGHAVAYTLLKG